jgi:hypothetical protein
MMQQLMESVFVVGDHVNLQSGRWTSEMQILPHPNSKGNEGE